MWIRASGHISVEQQMHRGHLKMKYYNKQTERRVQGYYSCSRQWVTKIDQHLFNPGLSISFIHSCYKIWTRVIQFTTQLFLKIQQVSNPASKRPLSRKVEIQPQLNTPVTANKCLQATLQTSRQMYWDKLESDVGPPRAGLDTPVSDLCHIRKKDGKS